MVLAFFASCTRAAPFREVLSIFAQPDGLGPVGQRHALQVGARKAARPVLSCAAVCPEVRVWPLCACATSLPRAHRVAEHVLVDLDHRPAVERHAQAGLGASDRGQGLDALVHPGGRLGGGIRRGEEHHHLVADQL